MPPPDKISTPEQAKGHKEYGAILCTAQKKALVPFEAFIKGLEQKGKITILARSQETRTKLWRSHEQVKIVYAGADKIEVDETIAAGLDYLAYTRKILVCISLSTPRVVDVWLKWNLKEHSASFQLRGGEIEIKEVKERNNADEVVRICHYSLKGELALAVQCLENMMAKELADPKTIAYSIVKDAV